MAGVLDAVRTKLGVPGRRRYETITPDPGFPGAANIKDKLQTLVLHVRLADRHLRIRRDTTWYLMALYYSGFQSIDLNPSGSTPSLDVFDRDDFFIENQFRKHVDTVVQILNRMEGDITVRPGSDSPKDLATARVSEPLMEMQREDIEYDRVLDIKNLMKCLFGNAFVFSDYIADKKFGSIVTPKYSYETRPGPDGEDMLTKLVSGYETRNKGKQICTVCSPLEINITPDIRPFTEVPYIQWKSRQDNETLQYLFPGLDIRGGHGTSAASSELAAQYLDILGNLPGNILGDSLAFNRGASERKKGELLRTWLQPCTFRQDKELLNAFPEGVHVTTVNGQVVDYYEEDLRDRWTHEILIPLPHSLFGDGLYDSVLMQDQINELDSLLIKHMRYSTTGKTYYESNSIDSKDIVNDPANGMVPVKLSMDAAIQQKVMQTMPNTLSQDVPAWLATMKSAMADMTGAYDPVTGKGMGANTPYSQSVFLTERAQSRWQGSLNYNRPELIRFHRNLLEDARANWADLRQRAVRDNTGEWSFRTFAESDLQGQVDIIISNTDFKPRSRAEQIQGLEKLVELVPLLPVLPPKQKMRVEEMLGLPPDANPMSTQISRAYRQIDRMKRGEVITPMPMIDDAAAQVPVLQDFLASEDGEATAEANPQIFSNIYIYMVTLLQMGMAQMNAGISAPSSPQGAPPSSPNAPRPTQPGQPGGQMGQEGGGSKLGGPVNMAQSPAEPKQPMPPIPG